jgi:hypothetical protein
MKVGRITDERMKDVCLFRQGEATCRYLQYGDRNSADTEALDSGWGCAKAYKESKTAVDLSAFSRVARGDNCSGPPDFVPRASATEKKSTRGAIMV